MARRMTVDEACGWWRDLVGNLPTGPDMTRLAAIARRYPAIRVEWAIGVVGEARLPPAKRIALLCAYFGEAP